MIVLEYQNLFWKGCIPDSIKRNFCNQKRSRCTSMNIYDRKINGEEIRTLYGQELQMTKRPYIYDIHTEGR